MAWRSLVVMQRQLDILNRQQDIFSRRPDMRMRLLTGGGWVDADNATLRMEARGLVNVAVAVRNEGTQSGRDVYLHITFPAPLQVVGHMTPLHPGPHDGQVVSGHVPGPIYPQRNGDAGSFQLHLPDEEGMHNVPFEIVSDEGTKRMTFSIRVQAADKPA